MEAEFRFAVRLKNKALDLDEDWPFDEAVLENGHTLFLHWNSDEYLDNIHLLLKLRNPDELIIRVAEAHCEVCMAKGYWCADEHYANSICGRCKEVVVPCDDIYVPWRRRWRWRA